jgi:two-component system, chemotaxis family, chemotaxis protein CheY
VERPPLILVVDDDPDILDAVCDVLTGEGYRVARARNGREALERVSDERPDLILLDLMMPVMDGLAFARALKASGVTPPVPVVVISADGNPDHAAGVGAEAFLPKPFDLEALLAAVWLAGAGPESAGASRA